MSHVQDPNYKDWLSVSRKTTVSFARRAYFLVHKLLDLVKDLNLVKGLEGVKVSSLPYLSLNLRPSSVN